LVADVDEHLVLVDADDGAVHDLPLVDLGESGVVIGDELPVGTLDPDTGFFLHQIIGRQSGGKYSYAFAAGHRRPQTRNQAAQPTGMPASVGAGSRSVAWRDCPHP